MKILIAHNRYRQPGGEETVFEGERDLLIAAGHQVSTLDVCNDGISSTLSVLKAALGTTYSFAGKRMMAEAIRSAQPDIVHVHNFFPLLSPAIFDACVEAGVPSVLTLHNYRLACAGAFLLRDNRPCEDCIGRIPWRAVRHKCYRNSTLASASLAAMIGFHAAVGTWAHKVDRFVALSDFARNLFIRIGLPESRIVVKPNFVAKAAPGVRNGKLRTGYLYAGRLSPEKGISVLLDAWSTLSLPLTIIGDGPLGAQVAAAAARNPAIQWAGQQERVVVLQKMAAARAVVIPSVWYEMFPLSMIEALSLGTPLIASRIGAPGTVVQDGYSGSLFEPGNVAALREAVINFDARDDLDRIGANAQESWRTSYSPEAGLDALMRIYLPLIENKVNKSA